MKKVSTSPLVSIVVLNWNGLKDTLDCLEHVRKLDYPNFEVVVVDNGSVDGSKERLSALPGIIYVDNPKNRGFTGGHIDGLAHCSGEFIVLLNNDAIMKSDYLTKAMEHFKDPTVGAVGGRSYWWNNENEPLDDSNAFYSFQEIDPVTGEARMLSHDYGRVQEVNNISGSCAIVRKSVIDEIDYLYDRFFAYFEETDLFARMKRANYRVLFDPELRIWHRNGASSGASSGSYFFFYQIFRNRFIFATRNFETKALLRFWCIYAKLSVKSTLKWSLKRGDSTMNYAYSRAALHNLYTLPWTLASRCSLRRKLGHSHYNHQIRGEQQGVSIVVDCTEANAKVLATILKQITSDQNPLHEYVLVAGEAKKLPVLPDNARYVVDRGYFDGPALNLGCLAARYSWMLACSASDFPNQDVISWPLHHLAADKRLVLFGKTGVNRASYVYIRKALFEEVGGLRRQETIDPVSRLVNYALAERCVYWAPAPEDAMLTPVSISFSSEEKKALRKAIHFNKSLLQTKTVGWFGRAQQKYYRLYQIVTLVHWLFVWRIPMRLKLARLRNVTIFIVKLQMRPLALELKHMHNEVLLYGDRHFHVHEQQAMTKEKLAVVRKNPTDVPVFIICFERILALEILVDWLASHGFKKIVFIDNDSTYQPLLDYYEKTPYQVLRLNRNVGHTSPWTLSIVRSLVPNDFYIVTDPDVIPVEECPKDFMKYFIGLHEQFLEYQKVGFGLNIDDLPDHYPLKDSVIEWESQFWKHSVAPEVYEAGVDTTFALYKPFTYNYMLHPSLRTGKPYTARHLPWYANPAEITEEEKYYRFRANSSISSWNTDVLKDRYAKEMGDN